MNSIIKKINCNADYDFFNNFKSDIEYNRLKNQLENIVNQIEADTISAVSFTYYDDRLFKHRIIIYMLGAEIRIT